MASDGGSGFASSARPLGQSTIQVNQAVAVRFKAGTHGIPGINGDFAGSVRHHLPHPVLFVMTVDRIGNAHPGGALAGLQLANPEAFPEAVPSRAREVEPGRQHAIAPRSCGF